MRDRTIAKVLKMDKNRISGSGKQIKGKVKAAVGKAIGDAKLEADGKSDQAKGKVQNAVGSIKDSLKR
ncbi:MAG: CsbD family protein [Pseudomonadota bacterium]